MSQGQTKFLMVQVISLVLTGGVFALDLVTPLGIPIGILYLAPILVLSWAPSKTFPFIVAGLCSILTGLGFWLSPPAVIVLDGLTNRLIIVLVLWSAAFGASTISKTDPGSERLFFGLNRRTLAYLTSLGLLVILLGIGSYRVTAASRESNKLVAHSHEVLTELPLTLSAIKDSEIGQRDFLLTGEERYLEPYRKAVSEVHGHLDRLVDLTRDSPELQDRIAVFASRVEAKLAELQETLVLSQNQGPAAALRIVTTGRRKVFMDDLRRQVEEIEKTERDLLVQQQQQVKSFSDMQVGMLVLGGLLMVVVVSMIVLFMRREQLMQREFAATLRRTLAALDATRDGLFVFEPGTLQFSYVNEGAVLQVGYSRAELLRMTPLDIEQEFDEPRFRAMIEPLVSGMQSVHSFTTVHRCKDGSDVPVEINLQAVDNGMAQCRLIAVARDIAERQRAENAQRRLAAIVEWTDDAIIGKTLNAIITSWNKGAERLYGYKAEEVIGKSIKVLIPQDRWGEEMEVIGRVRRGEQVQYFETVRQTRDGRLIDISLTVSPLKDQHGTIVGISGIGRDITQRKREEEKFRRVVEGASNAMILVNQKGAIVLVNVQAERLFGYSREELLGQSIETLVPVRFRHAHPGHRAAFFADPKTRAMGAGRDLYGLHKDGRMIPLEIGLNPIETEEGRMVLSSIVDITERKQAEEEINRRGQLLEAINKELEAFSYSVSHDLRAPLRSLHGFSQALIEDYAGRLDEKGIDYLNRIQASSLRMGQLVEDLLQLSRTTRMELRREPVDLSALALSRAEEMQKLWPGRQVELVVEPGLKAEGDPRLLDIVFDNLLNNAWKFTGRRERAVIEVGAERRERETVYFVRDNGAGFDMAYAGKLFGAFQRLHAMTEFPGTGIGLATVQRIVYRHGGRVWAEAAVDKGATVFFTLGDEREGAASLISV